MRSLYRFIVRFDCRGGRERSEDHRRRREVDHERRSEISGYVSDVHMDGTRSGIWTARQGVDRIEADAIGEQAIRL
jgi:hypothetical protein